jgi:hypothetical protein
VDVGVGGWVIDVGVLSWVLWCGGGGAGQWLGNHHFGENYDFNILSNY